MKKYLPLTTEERIAHAELNGLKWKLCLKYTIILVALLFVMFG